MTNEEMKSYWSQEVAKMLNISTSTLRKWSIALESEGYYFIRDENGKRAYLERDLMPLHKMRELLSSGMSVNNASNAVVLRFYEQISDSRTVVVREENQRSLERYSELITQKFQEVRNENKELKEYLNYMNLQMQEQNDNITKLLKEQVKMREMLEKKKWWNFW